MSTTKHLDAWITIEKLDCEGYPIGEIEVNVIGKYTPVDRGSRGHYGEPMEPDSPDSVEVLSATTADGEEYELNREEEKQAEQALWGEVPD